MTNYLHIIGMCMVEFQFILDNFKLLVCEWNATQQGKKDDAARGCHSSMSHDPPMLVQD